MRFPSWLTWYRKPEYRDIKEYATTVSAGTRSLSPDGRGHGKSSVPFRLRLDRILENKTCSPMSLYDFYMYLKYIEFSSENLEFYIWFKNYESAYANGGGVINDDRGYGSCGRSASESTSSITKHDTSHTLRASTEDGNDPETAKETLARISQLISTDALCSRSNKSRCQAAAPTLPQPAAPAMTENKWTDAVSLSDWSTSTKGPTLQIMNLDPKQTPRRSEVNTVVELFLVPGSEKELNIPPAIRRAALSALEVTSHPDALRPVADHVYGLLRNCSHRNFVRLGVGNGTFETVCVATVLGIGNMLGGFLLVLCRAFVPFRGAHTRWDAFAAWPLWWLGLSLILSGLRGSCFFLLLFSRRQALPWERFDDDSASGHSTTPSYGIWTAIKRLMIFDRRLRVDEVHLRRLQRKIVLQSLTGGAIFASACVLLFIFLPVWSETAHQPLSV
ncbi:hypothetical protein QBC46DRAFT_367658 [Diplogelasinospora grovesii]|uniref:RGS domain-containing protein n=1 Tax=Diplogelasinospora grovesii TaxID=303347 RepID=A0AAN6MXT9_9PEZI|nr:hypothetical protein QBC46DRAFT_367658 [Diplogelasinospora grovesii]